MGVPFGVPTLTVPLNITDFPDALYVDDRLTSPSVKPNTLRSLERLILSLFSLPFSMTRPGEPMSPKSTLLERVLSRVAFKSPYIMNRFGRL